MQITNRKLIKVEPTDIEDGMVTVPDFVEELEEGCFARLNTLEYVNLPKNLKIIGKDVFYGCENLKEIILPESLEYLGIGAFDSCTSLKNVELPEKLTLVRGIFRSCFSLKSINLPSNTEIIPTNCFFHSGLTKIDLPKGVKQVDNGAFNFCNDLTEVNLPDTVTSIGNIAFARTKIKEINLPKDCTFIGQNAFTGCSNLKKVTIPAKIKSLSKTFNYCESLESVDLPEGLEELDDVFAGCKLNFLYVPQSVKFASYLCSTRDINFLSINKDTKCIGPLINLDYYTLQDDRFVFTKNKLIEESVFVGDLEDVNMGIIMQCSEDIEKIRQLSTDKNSILILNKCYEALPLQQFKEVFNNGNLKFLKGLLKLTDIPTTKEFFKLYYNLGGFRQPEILRKRTKSGNIITKKVDYAQKVGEFLKELYFEDEKIFKDHEEDSFFNNISKSFQEMPNHGFKIEFSDFFLNKENIQQLLREENKNEGFIARCYASFEDVQKTNTSNKGNQRQLKPTIQKFKEYFAEMKFTGLTKENIKIAKTIKPYFHKQSDFEDAVEIEHQRKLAGTGTRILKSHLFEKDVFSSIKEYKKKIQDSSVDIMHMLVDLVGKEFTYEFMEKDDPQNFILGKLCSCCAHLEGHGYGIMKASIIHPDIQNLVIRNKKDEIIAKATLYINREQCYGVCNTFSVNETVDARQKPQLLAKFKEALKDFANQYNKENKNKPLKKITVGLGMNRLEAVFTDKEKPSAILKTVDYSQYGKELQSYPGDSKNEQVVVWQEDEKDV